MLCSCACYAFSDIYPQKCYVSLVENLHFEDVECLKYSLSKGLGIGIVVGGSIMKVPQLLLSLYLSPLFCEPAN